VFVFIVADRRGGCVMVTKAVLLQAKLSFTVTVYVPAVNPETVVVTWKPGDHEYV